MKKILILLLLLPFFASAQKHTDIVTNYKGIEITGTSYVRNTKEGKTEYGITVTYKNTTDKNIFFKKSTKALYLAKVYLKNRKSYVYEITGATEKKGKVKIGMLRKGETYESYIYFPWYKNTEVPEFIFEVNDFATLEME